MIPEHQSQMLPAYNVYKAIGSTVYSLSPTIPIISRTEDQHRGCSAVELCVSIGRPGLPMPGPTNTLADFHGDVDPFVPWTGIAAGGWAWNAGTAAMDHTAGTAGDLTCPEAKQVLQGAKYRVVFEVDNWTADSVRVSLGGTLGTARGADGVYTEDIIAGAGGDVLVVAPSAFGGSVKGLFWFQIPPDMTVGLFPASYFPRGTQGSNTGPGFVTADLPLITSALTISAAQYPLLNNAEPFRDILVAEWKDFPSGVVVGVLGARPWSDGGYFVSSRRIAVRE